MTPSLRSRLALGRLVRQRECARLQDQIPVLPANVPWKGSFGHIPEEFVFCTRTRRHWELDRGWQSVRESSSAMAAKCTFRIIAVAGRSLRSGCPGTTPSNRPRDRARWRHPSKYFQLPGKLIAAVFARCKAGTTIQEIVGSSQRVDHLLGSVDDGAREQSSGITPSLAR
jgi:hypothetical protein